MHHCIQVFEVLAWLPFWALPAIFFADGSPIIIQKLNLNFTIFKNNPWFWFLVYFVVRKTFEPLSIAHPEISKWKTDDAWYQIVGHLQWTMTGRLVLRINVVSVPAATFFKNQTKQKRGPRLQFWTRDQPRGRRTFIQEGTREWTRTTNVWMRNSTPTFVRNVEWKAVIG